MKYKFMHKKGNNKWVDSIDTCLKGNALKSVLGDGTMIDFSAKKQSLAQKILVSLIIVPSFLPVPHGGGGWSVQYVSGCTQLSPLRLDQTISWLCSGFLPGHLLPQAKIGVKKALTRQGWSHREQRALRSGQAELWTPQLGFGRNQKGVMSNYRFETKLVSLDSLCTLHFVEVLILRSFSRMLHS